MAHTTTLPTTVRVGHRLRPARRLAKLARDWFRAYTTWRNREITRAVLRGLDDRTLKDVGLHRSQINSLEFDASNRKVRKPGGHWRALRWL